MSNIFESPIVFAIFVIALAAVTIWLLTRLGHLVILINDRSSNTLSLVDAIRIAYKIHERLALENAEIKAELAQTTWVYLSPIAFDMKEGKPFAILGSNNQVVALYNITTGECTIVSGTSLVGNLGSFYIK